MFEDYRITCICPQCEDYDFSDEEDKNEDTNGNNWEFLSDPDISESEMEEEEDNQLSNSSRSSIESLPILQPYQGSSQPLQSLQSQQAQLHGLLELASPESVVLIDDDEDMYDGTGEEPASEVKTIVTDMPLTPDSLPGEDHGKSPSTLSQLQITQPSNSGSTSHSLESNEAVNGDAEDSQTNNSVPTFLSDGIVSEVEEVREKPVRGVFGTSVGILGYGPFELNSLTEKANGLSINPSLVEFRLYLHQTEIYDALDLFAYGGTQYEHDQYALIYHMPASPQVCNYTNDLTREELAFFEEVEKYLDGQQYPDGVPIPRNLMGDFIRNIYHDNEGPQYRFPKFEQLIATIAAQFAHKRFSHPSSQRMLERIHHLVQPTYPTIHNEDLFNLRCPELPYLQPEFEQDEPRHPDDTGDQLPNDYFGCLPRKEAFIFQQLYPKFSDTIYYTAVATRELLTIHARSEVAFPTPTQLNWRELLDPFPFHLVFEDAPTPEALVNHIQQLTSGTPNQWISQVPHILQCSRQLSLFIQQLETFFQTLGFCGLCELADKVALNTNVTFVHNALLDSNEAAYLTAAYDFFLREHKCSTANEILNILHLPFPNPFQFFLVREQIVDIIDPAPYIYSLCEGDGMDSVEEEN